MKIVIAPQSFKGTATASVVAGAMLDGVKKELPSLVQDAMPEMPKVPDMTGPVLPFGK